MHTDLTYPLRRVGYMGGLKAIERMRGVTRSKDMLGSQGCAVRLRHEYERGSDDALELLLKCEPGAVVDLETIIEPRAS
jgi:uncharacterized protein YprB with RNaseH-like and TPR domain